MFSSSDLKLRSRTVVKTNFKTMASDKSNVDQESKYIVKVVFVSLLLDLLAFTMILPLLPSLMEHYRKYDSKDGLYPFLLEKVENFRSLVGAPERFNSVLFGGLLGSLFSFLQFVASPLVGGLSDVYGRKPILVLCLLGISMSYLLWAVSHSFAMFVLARVVGGISKGNVSLSMAIITDSSTSNKRGFGMALVGIAFSVGFIVGPVIGAMFARWGQTQTENSDWFVMPALFAFSLALADIIFVVFFFRETLPSKKRASLSASISQTTAYISVPALFNFTAVTDLPAKDSKELRMLGLVYFVYLFLYSGLEFTLTFLTHLTFGFNSMQQGYMFFCIGLVMAVLQGGYVRRIPPHNTKKMASFGLLLIVPSFLCVALASTTILLYTGLFLYAVSTAFVVPCMTTMASQFGSVAQKGTVMGIFRSLGALARAIGPVVASVCYWSLGSTLTYSLGGIALLWPWYTLNSTRR
ncbi:major facilitator superfamily domain-containing protein 10 [Macrosteles quadrilineatus]|uniref:major facilitator superfamily domain-containing protein 10 n=1 Tax=Macrosteles quadrilineatus TaxID=74068 RepID=UPI0023E09CB5|nr:major facilitator superfamily domain-containing protein 10 [Macrosteles quadrilineatus]